MTVQVFSLADAYMTGRGKVAESVDKGGAHTCQFVFYHKKIKLEWQSWYNVPNQSLSKINW